MTKFESNEIHLYILFGNQGQIYLIYVTIAV